MPRSRSSPTSTCAEVRRASAPALDGDHAVARVDARHHVIAAAAHGRTNEVVVGGELGAEHDPLGARLGETAERLKRADSPAHLEPRIRLARDALDDIDVAGHAVARAVEVDDVDPLGAGLEELARLGHRVVVVDGHAVVVALGETHGLAAQNVDCRKDDHRPVPPFSTSLPKFASRCRPAVDDFSGWNCTA